MWYLIFNHGHTVYIHEYETKKEALEEYKHYSHVKEENCKIILAVGDVLNRYKLEDGKLYE